MPRVCFLTSSLQHRKEKPWDHDGINHWEVQPFKKEENPSGLLEESAFATLFPKYRGELALGNWLGRHALTGSRHREV